MSRAISQRGRYLQQKQNAKQRGIEFYLSFGQWFAIWALSGHMHERGRLKGRYVMGRIGDRGAYESGNVVILEAGQNVRDGLTEDVRGRIGAGVSRRLIEDWKDPAFREKILPNIDQTGHKRSAESVAKMKKSRAEMLNDPVRGAAFRKNASVKMREHFKKPGERERHGAAISAGMRGRAAGRETREGFV